MNKEKCVQTFAGVAMHSFNEAEALKKEGPDDGGLKVNRKDGRGGV